jgi:hypothetical protein
MEKYLTQSTFLAKLYLHLRRVVGKHASDRSCAVHVDTPYPLDCPTTSRDQFVEWSSLTKGRIFSHVRPLYEWAVSDLDPEIYA